MSSIKTTIVKKEEDGSKNKKNKGFLSRGMKPVKKEEDDDDDTEGTSNDTASIHNSVNDLCEALTVCTVDCGFSEYVVVDANCARDSNSDKNINKNNNIVPAMSDVHKSRQARKKEYAIPRQWGEYSKVGNVVPTTPFLPFKTPFCEERFIRHPHLEQHTIISLIEELTQKGIRLAVVIDLTLPQFYETDLLEAFGVQYEKIRIDNQEPRWHQVKKFLDICDRFTKEQNEKRQIFMKRQEERKKEGLDEERYMYEVIGVHCTRGVNRTGYMICRAMIERLGCTAEKAVELFNEARGHEMSEFMPELKKAELNKRRFEQKKYYRDLHEAASQRGRGGYHHQPKAYSK